PGIKSADAQIDDDEGRVVARRSLSDSTAGSCLALVHAVSAWAEVVLDDELARAHEDAGRREREVAPKRLDRRPITPVVVAARPADAARPVDADEAAARPGTAPQRTFEVGTMLFLRN